MCRDQELKTCSGCGRHIYHNQFAICIDEGYYHVTCFRCVTCHRVLEHGRDMYGLKASFSSLHHNNSDAMKYSASNKSSSSSFQPHGLIYCAAHYPTSSATPPLPLLPPTSTNLAQPPPTTSTPPLSATSPPAAHVIAKRTNGTRNRKPAAVTLKANTTSNRKRKSQYNDNNNKEHANRVKFQRTKTEDELLLESYNLDSNETPTSHVTRVSSSTASTSAAAARAKRIRTSFHQTQISLLKEYFATNHNPDNDELRRIIDTTRLPKRVIQVWFQNARAKWRKHLLSSPATAQCGPHVTSDAYPLGEGHDRGHVDTDEQAGASSKNLSDANNNDQDCSLAEEEENSSVTIYYEVNPNCCENSGSVSNLSLE